MILETAAIEPWQIETVARLALDAGADFLKTSTGFHPTGGATVEAVVGAGRGGRGAGAGEGVGWDP